jgi:hypothetical protein
MSFKEVFKKEKYVVMHGQSGRFRIIKYLIIVPIFAGVYFWKGWGATSKLLLVLFAVSIFIHFLFRYKSKAWTEPWGPYKPTLPTIKK